MDTRAKYIASLQEEGLIKVEFVKSEFNHSDIATKNVSVDLFEYHVQHIIEDKKDVESSSRKGVGDVDSDPTSSHHNSDGGGSNKS